MRQLLARVLAWRFVRFGLVGGSGTVVNSVVLYVAQEHALHAITPASFRLNFSIAIAIFIATVNNFLWNRVVTWMDRNANETRPILSLFAQYCASAGLAIALQFIMTKTLAGHLHYLVANLIAIAASSVLNYIANDRWTFRQRRIDPPSS